MQVELEFLFVFEHRKAFRIGLHQTVLDPVMDHLGEMTRAARADMAPAALAARRKRRENRPEPRNGRLIAADHEAVTVFQSPHSTAGSDIDEKYFLRRKEL